MKSLEAIFVQTPEREVYAKLRSVLEGDNQECMIKGIRCTKKAFSLFETRGKELLAKKQLENFQVLLSTLRQYATPTLKQFKKFKGFGLAEMITWLDRLVSDPRPHPSLTKTLEELVSTVGVVAEHSLDMAMSLMVFVPTLLKIGSDHYKPVTLRFEVVRILNDLLKQCPVSDKRGLMKGQPVKESLVHMGANLNNAGDFELQVGLLETLSRFTDAADRRTLGPAWFNRINLTDQYLAIREEEFDILYKPSGISEFWVDFNTSSNCISLFTEDATAAEEERMWETVFIKRDEVMSWNVVKDKSCGNNTWRVDIILHSPLPIPWKTTPTSTQVTIQFSADPRAALVKSIGNDKELDFLNSKAEIPSHSKTSIAVMPIRVTSPAEQSHAQSTESGCGVSPVTPDKHLSEVMFQMSSQETIKSKEETPVKRPPPPPITPHTSTPKVKQFIRPASPQQKSCSVARQTNTTTSLTGTAAKRKTPKLVKQPLSFSTKRNDIDSDFAMSKRGSLKEKTVAHPKVQPSSVTAERKSAKCKPKDQKLSSSNCSIQLDTTEEGVCSKRKHCCTKSIADMTFDFPDSPRRRPLTKSIKRRRKKGSCDTVLLSNSMASDSGVKSKERKLTYSENAKKLPKKLVTNETAVPCLSDSNALIDNYTHIDETVLVNDPTPVLHDEVATNEVPRLSPANEVPMLSPVLSLRRSSDREEENEMRGSSQPAVTELDIEEPQVCDSNDLDEPQSGFETTSHNSTIISGSQSVNDDIPDVHNDDNDVESMSLSSFHSSQVEPDLRVVKEFEEACQSVLNSSRDILPKSKTKERFSLNKSTRKMSLQLTEEADSPSPPKKPRLAEAQVPSLFYSKQKRRSSNKITPPSPLSPPKRVCTLNSYTRDVPSPNCSTTTTSTTLRRDKDHNNNNDRGFLFSFEGQLDKELAQGEDKLQKAQENYDTAMKAIEGMCSETNSVNNITLRIKELHDTLFANLNTINQQDSCDKQRRCLSVMEEMKLQRQKMLKQAHDREVQHVRKTLQSLIMCWQLS